MTDPDTSTEPEEFDDVELFNMDIEQNDPDESGYLGGSSMGGPL